VSNLAAVHFASGADFDTFAKHEQAEAVGVAATNPGLRTLSSNTRQASVRLHRPRDATTHARLA
jgi:hypothetical protein